MLVRIARSAESVVKRAVSVATMCMPVEPLSDRVAALLKSDNSVSVEGAMVSEQKPWLPSCAYLRNIHVRS